MSEGAAWDLLRRSFKPHPWHGVELGPEAPSTVVAYVEIVPTDTVKYEIDKPTGYLRIDRPQRFSNVCPSLYGFLPQTLCGEAIAELCRRRVGRAVSGDGDPLDVCVLTERQVSRGDVLVRALPIGGLRMIDGDQADDKVVAVLEADAVFGRLRELDELPPDLVDRLRHYFLTYKQPPGGATVVEIAEVYGREAAYEVIEASRADYRRRFPAPAAGPGGEAAR